MLTRLNKAWCKHRLVFFSGTIILFCFLFWLIPITTKAAWYSFMVDSLTWLPLMILRISLGFVMAVGYLLMRLSHHILMFVLNNPLPDGLSMTNPATNPIINIGWTALRDFTNMLFILGLAYIGLMTALNLSSFNTKKTFTNLLLIALLINFTPVICGAIVDGSNIIANFFLNGVSYSNTLDTLKGVYNLDTAFGFDFEEGLSNLIKIIGII
ncbi:hypothetical protein FJ208_00840, partial [Candidatus Gribaldobacteria bacterium]|nr:hypothetical protein [Candidatus Gribaldobacteria bacterium]